MADMPTLADEKPSPSHEDLQQSAAGNGAPDSHIPRRNRMSAEDEDDDDDKPGRERRKIEIKFIQDKSRRHITFSKRKAGIMKKVHRASFLFCLSLCPLVFVSSDADRRCYRIGVRALRPDWNPSPAAGRVRDGSRLHLHHPQAPTSGDQGRGKEPDSGEWRSLFHGRLSQTVADASR